MNRKLHNADDKQLMLAAVSGNLLYIASDLDPVDALQFE